MFAVKITKENKELLSNWLKSRPNIDRSFLHPLTIGEYVLSEPSYDYSYQLWSNSLLGRSNIEEVYTIKFMSIVDPIAEEVKVNKPGLSIPQVKSNIFKGFGGI